MIEYRAIVNSLEVVRQMLATCFDLNGPTIRRS